MSLTGSLSRAALLLAVLALAGCGEGGLAGGLRSAGIGADTPDEFMVLPTKPLEMPPDLASLPPPAPGGGSRVDYHPRQEAVAALTGQPTAPGSGSAGPLVASAGPVDPGIRARLAAEDAVYRRENRGRLLERWFTRNPEALTYRRQALDQTEAFEGARAAGLRVPPAPPPEVEPID
jgi:Protein of unknown function (DUF3035)